jgi:amino acid adenylation domain-containing protein
MAGRFPGARSVAEFWRNQLDGIESISHFRVEELEIPDAAELSQDANYVRARSILEDVDLFDAEFFGIYPREAELMDPQQRLFLECCWQAFEDAGYDPAVYPGPIGVYAGCSTSTYFLSQLCTDPRFIRKFTGGYQVGNYPEMMGNNVDFLATRVAYKLNLRGPAFTMQSGCSTSLLAVTQACQSLLTYQSDMALAGGSSITFPQKRGSYYQEGGMVSPDGHCRAFDADAQGTVFGSGVAVVLLKRLEDAVRDGDQIYAVIRGFAANNDGSTKVGYTAPSVEGQARVIALAQEAAGIDPQTIGYIEAHGTGTPLGDPIELAALTQAFRAHASRKHFCAVGTAKTNVGHLDIAAGVTGLINASHIVRDGVFPPTLHFKKPNPQFDLESSPFYVNAKLSEWKTGGELRRAGVSAFGVGGTNAHVIIEQAPTRSSKLSTRPQQLLVLSARTEGALEHATDNLTEFLKSHPDTNLADAAWTLQAGRRAFPCRRTVVAAAVDDAVVTLAQRDRKRMQTRLRASDNPQVNFLFPGQGSQYPNMGREIYQTERVFREAVDRCAEILLPHLGADIRTLLYPAETASEEAKRRVTDTIVAQPAIFTIEYALAQLWTSWGIRPQAMLGHSVGEFVAACLAGIFSLEDALTLVAARGRMMQEVPAGGMLSVRLPEAEVSSRLNGHLSLAAVNSPSLCVVAGPFDALEKFEQQLTGEGVACRRLVTSHAFHSAMMDPILKPFTARVEKVRLKPPQIPYVSGVTGTWITEKEATDPGYWARHFRQAVQFSAGVSELRKKSSAILLEVGPGNVLSTLARQHTGFSADQVIVSSLADGFSGEGDSVALMNSLGSLWVGGVLPNWPALHGGERRLRMSLPTYPLERKRYWLEAPAEGAVPPPVAAANELTETVIELPVEEMEPVNATSQSPVDASAPSRANKIRAILVEIFEDLSGMNLTEADGSTTFLELGFDSLFLTQVTQALQSKFGLKITFRQLLGDLGAMNALAEYVDNKLPGDVFSEPAPAPVPTQTAPAPTAAIASTRPATAARTAASVGGNGDTAMAESPVDRLIREQLDAMNQLFAKQLEAIRGTAPASAPVSTASPATARSAGNSPTAPQVAAPAAEKDGVKELKGYTPFKPLQKGSSGELTPRQVEYIRSLVERYTKRTALSKQNTQDYRQVLADPRVVAGFRAEWKEMVYPIVTVRSQGSRLWDVDGNEYIDILNGFGPIMLGHRPAFVEKAIEKQLHEGFEIGPQTLLAGEVAKMICEFTGNERATFCNTGSEAVIAAMRVARTVTGRNKVVFFSGDYHGMFDEVLVKGFKKGGVPQAVPVAPGIPREKAANVVVLEYGTAESLEWIRQNAKDLAAVMVEPVQSRHPNLQPIEFLKEIRKITEQSDTCLIFDEVVTGFRVHPGGCQALFGIRADLATYGKVLAGGMPIGVLAGTSKYMDALDGGMWQYGDDSYPSVGVTFFAGTFVRHPLTMAAVKAVLQYFQAEGPALQQRLSERTAGMVKRLNDLLERNHVPTHIENFASIFYFSFPADFRFGSLFYYHLREKGIHLLESFPCFLTTAHTDADIDRIVRAFEETIAEMQAGGALELPATEIAARSSQSAAQGPTRDVLMTEPQREIFLAAKLADDASCSFNESFSVHLRGPLQADALRESVNAVIARHEALRATVDAEGTALRFLPELKLAIPLRDISQMEPASRDAELKRTLAADARTAFDLTKGPLVRSELVRLEPDYHMLLVTSHHIVCDGWSTNVFLDELAKLYSAKVQGRSAGLPEAVRFSAYAQAQSAHRASAEGTEVEAYWLSQFKDVPPPLDLPVDRPRPSVKNYAGATYRTHIEGEDYRRIKQLGSKKGCTLFATLLAGFQALLHRLTNQNEIVVGIPAAGQSLLDDGNLIGHCVNFLPLRTKFREDLSFANLLGEVKKTLLDAYDHQSYTYGTLVRKLAIPLDPGRLPLMEVQFNLERIGAGAEFEGLKADVDPNPKSAVNFDIFFNVVESAQGLMIDCDYNTDLFDRTTIERWLGHYSTLLLAAAPGPDKAVDDLPLMTPPEVTSLLAAWNPAPSECKVDSTMHQIFEQQASQTPDAVAVVSGAERMTYRELNERANQLARTLRAKGVKPDSLVAVCFERSLEMIVSFLAVLKSGGAYLPIDSSYPKERLAMMLEDARPAVLLTQQRLVANLPEHKAEIVCVDKDWPEIDLEKKENLPSAARPENLAYVIYTSGSTGKPKGVMVTHANVVRLLKASEPWFRFNRQDVWTLFHSYAFDFSVWEIWGSLMTGGRLVVVPYWVTRSPQDFYNLLAQENVTVLSQTPAAFYQVIQVEESGFSKPLSLRYVIFGGEALNFTNLRPWFKRHGDKQPQLVNMYGITETTVHVTYRPIAAADCEGETRSLIGAPIPDLRLYLLDAKQKPVPEGVVGEMYVGGGGVARGYLNRPDLTAERFVPDPFAGHGSARMYKSGDLARFLKNGELEYLGRGDTQVKIHGFRIELGEIEAALAQHPGVHQASVTARKDGPGEKKLVAYFVAKSGSNPSGTELREFLQAKLPAHMIPFAYVLMASLPLTVNGKVDRDKLPAPDLGASAKTREYVAPSTPQEIILVDILKEVLRLERVGVTDNLFELGADSLHVFQITSRAAKAGVAVTPRLLLQQRTIAGVLAEMSKSPAEVRPQAPAITPVARDKYRVTREVSR